MMFLEKKYVPIQDIKAANKTWDFTAFLILVSNTERYS